MSMLDPLLLGYRRIASALGELTRRPTLAFLGDGVTVADDPEHDRTVVTIEAGMPDVEQKRLVGRDEGDTGAIALGDGLAFTGSDELEIADDAIGAEKFTPPLQSALESVGQTSQQTTLAASVVAQDEVADESSLAAETPELPASSDVEVAFKVTITDPADDSLLWRKAVLVLAHRAASGDVDDIEVIPVNVPDESDHSIAIAADGAKLKCTYTNASGSAANALILGHVTVAGVVVPSEE